MDELTTGSRVVLTQSNRTATVESFIGEGSQGAVYLVRIDSTGERMALKWYFPALSKERQKEAIAELIERGTPDFRFLWPVELAELPSQVSPNPPVAGRSFGYVMPLRDDSSIGLAALLKGKVDVSFSIVCTLGMELADTFLSLHNEGLCYRDISFGNVFFDPTTGRPLICDTDNVGVDGASQSSVLGTRRFMAPEIVRREAAPSTATDLYSLAVLLFYVLMVAHPLVGRRELEFPIWDDHAESVLFGHEPCFIFDPDNDANAPIPDTQASVMTYWGLYPPEIRKLFTQAFTSGLSDPLGGRVRESVWRAALSRVRDLIMRCPACGRENFWEEGAGGTCWSCDRRLPTPVRLLVDGRPLVLDVNTVLTRHHLHRDYDFSVVAGRVVAHPTQPGRWGLRNETSATWSVVLPDGEEMSAGPGQSGGLRPGTTKTAGNTPVVNEA